MGFSRKEDLILSNKYENLIELKFNNVVSSLRIEWELLKVKETVEMRNNRLLCELASLNAIISKKN